MENRTCDGCTLCCVLLEVEEIEKKAETRCERQTDKRCFQYERRPDACRAYECLWRQGAGPDWASPLRTGIVFDLGSPESRFERDVRTKAILARARDPRFFDVYWGSRAIDHWSKKRVVIRISGSYRRASGPPGLMRAFVQFVESQKKVVG